MKLDNLELVFVEAERKVSLHKDFGNGIFMYADIFVLGDKFIEYQKDLFTGALADLSDKLTGDNNIDVNDFKKFFEQLLQDLNSKLMIFSEKIKDVTSFPIKGVINIFFENIYMASFIGDVSIVVLRNNKINHFLDNSYVDEGQKIDYFSDLIEGDLESGDNIIFAGTNIMNVLDKDDIVGSMELSKSEDRSLIEIVRDICATRIDLKEIAVLSYFSIEYSISIIKPNLQEKFQKKLVLFKGAKDLVLKFRFPIIISLGVLFIFFLFYFIIVKNISGSNILTINGDTVVIDFTIEDLKRDLDLFKKLDASSDEKAAKYNELLGKLNLLEQKNKWPYDVKELKGILNSEYYKGFNIAMIDNLDQYNVYKFDDAEKQTLGNVNTVFYGNSFMIGGTKGAVISALNDKVRGKSINYNLPIDINKCTNNLLKDGLYCFSSDGNIINITKSGVQTVSNKSGNFSSGLQDIAAYGKSSLYTFPSITDNGILNYRYNNVVGSQVQFSDGVNYALDKTFFDANKDTLLAGFSDFYVDGTFLGWSKLQKKLYQFWRDSKTGIINGRKVDVSGGEMLGSGYSDDVKVMVFKDNVYLFDRINKTFTVYSTAPHRTNDAYYNSYKMTYFFRLDFALLNYKVEDVYVEETEKRSLFLVTSEGIYKVKLYDFEESFKKK